MHTSEQAALLSHAFNSLTMLWRLALLLALFSDGSFHSHSPAPWTLAAGLCSACCLSAPVSRAHPRPLADILLLLVLIAR